jgi:hypothetical protein
MKRTTKYSSIIFKEVLRQAEEQLALAGRQAANYQHRGIRGDERANALREFLSKHIPSSFATGKGEAIDYQDRRTGEIDLCVYDVATASPIQTSGDNALFPAEALYAIIEVKSILSQDEIRKCVAAAKKVRALRPFKQQFGGAQTRGAASTDARCIYIVFAYATNLSEDGWAQKEFERIQTAVRLEDCPLDVIDRVIVLDRGMIQPQVARARIKEESKGIFLEFYIHLMNFLMRERRRRDEIDWTAYTARTTWIKLAE